MAAVWDRIDAELTRRGMTWADLGRQIDATDQTMHNWKGRGVPAARHKAIADALGWKVDHLISEHWPPEQPPPAGVSVRPVAQEMSQPEPDDEPPQHTWEFILSAAVTDLSKRFIAAVPDGALAPTTPKGTEYLFAAPAGQPRDSVVVIVQTAAGRRFMRLFFALDGGAWEARARDSAYPSLHSVRDGLQLLAVATMRPGGEG